MLYSYNDISIIPSELSYISSRSECDPFIDGNLPIFTAPMSCIVDEGNAAEYEKGKIIPIIPRSVLLKVRMRQLALGRWVAFSLSEFEALDDEASDGARICVDLANGHMKRLYDSVSYFKSKHPSSEIMVGNIANPETVTYAALSGADYIRLGIGSGNGCITSSNTGVHYPMASLVDWSAKVKKDCGHEIKLIADGGIRGFADINKAIALGADYVMIGSLFSQCLESNNAFYDKNGTRKYGTANYKDNELYHKFYGMASKEGQGDLFGEKRHTAEGICKIIRVNGTLSQWSENAADYLRSAMSYCDARTLSEFRKKAEVIEISNNAYNSINK